MSPREGDERISRVEWESPPKRVTYDWASIAEQLRANPMEWAKIWDTGRTTTVNAVRQGSVRVLHPDLGFEVRTANNTFTPPRTCTFWLRFNPSKVKKTRRK